MASHHHNSPHFLSVLASLLSLTWLHVVVFPLALPYPRLASAVDIRLAEGVDRPPSPPANEAQASLQAAKRPPGLVTGPSLLVASQGECVTTMSGDYEYAVCLFRNVTQRKPTDRFKVSVGVWSHWRVETSPDDGTDGGNAGGKSPSYFMVYNDGDSCTGNSSRSATIKILCDSSDFTLGRIQEPHMCDYTMDLTVPLPCSAFTPDLDTQPPPTSSTSSSSSSSMSGGGGTVPTGGVSHSLPAAGQHTAPLGDRAAASQLAHSGGRGYNPPPPLPSYRQKPTRLLSRCRDKHRSSSSRPQGTCDMSGGGGGGSMGDDEPVEDCLMDEIDRISQQVESSRVQVQEELASIKKSLAELRSLLIDNLPHDYPQAAA